MPMSIYIMVFNKIGSTEISVLRIRGISVGTFLCYMQVPVVTVTSHDSLSFFFFFFFDRLESMRWYQGVFAFG